MTEEKHCSICDEKESRYCIIKWIFVNDEKIFLCEHCGRIEVIDTLFEDERGIDGSWDEILAAKVLKHLKKNEKMYAENGY